MKKVLKPIFQEVNSMCHRHKDNIKNTGRYGDGDVPESDIEPYKNIEPLPESTRERRDGPGGD